MTITRRAAVTGLAVAAISAALPSPAFARPVQRYRNPNLLIELASPPKGAAQVRAADPFLFGSRWHYQSLGDGWGAIRHLATGRAWTTLPGSRPSAWSIIRQALPILRDEEADDRAALSRLRSLSQAAAQAATWAEEVGGGTLYLSFRADRGGDSPYMRAEDAPPLVAVDGSSGTAEDFYLFA